MKKLLPILTLLFTYTLHAQPYKIDTIIDNGVFLSYFNDSLHEPVYVSYTLYKGGGDCSRDGLRFTTNDLPHSATASDYANNGYDEGHLCNAEDEAYDCNREGETFHFFNCVPQTKELNRGIWKHYETIVRKDSQTDSLYIICGSIFGDKTIGKQHIAVPEYCWKVVYSMTTWKVLYCLMFPNDSSDQYYDISTNDLEEQIGIKLKYFFNQ